MTEKNTHKQTENYEKAIKQISLFLTKHLYKLLFLLILINYIDISLFLHSYIDPDSYMRVIRIYNWLKAPSFFEQPILESNYPFGEISHWTRPMDILWLFCSLPFFPFMPLKTSLLTGGHLLSPLFYLLSIWSLAYGLKRCFNIWLTFIGCLIFLANQEFQLYFAPNYPDHHSLMMFLSLTVAMQTLCWCNTPQKKYLINMGFILAFATAVAIEGIFLLAIFLLPFIWQYLKCNTARSFILQILKYYTITLTLFWQFNPPYEGWFYPDNGRVSILFITGAWLGYIGFWIINKLALQTTLKRILALIILGIVITSFLLLIFGTNILLPPLDIELNQIWASRIVEMQSFWQFSIQKQVKYYLFAIIALLLNICLMKNNTYHTILRLNLFWGTPLFIMSLFAGRFTAYQVVFAIIPYLALIAIIYQKSAFAKDKSKDFPVSVWVCIIAVFLFEVSVNLPNTLYPPKEQTTIEIANKNVIQNIKAIGGTLVTDVFLSPQYMWMCGVNTVGTPYHRNRIGLIDNHNILHATNNQTLLTLLKKHQITQILLFADYDDDYYSLKEKYADKLYYRLIKRENVPPFFKEIPSTIDYIRHYEVKYDVDFPISSLESNTLSAIIKP